MSQPTDADYRVVLATLLGKLAATLEHSDHGQVMNEDINDMVKKSFAENGVVMPEILRGKFDRKV
jgi:flagellar biosynthesis component FlhA